MLLLLWRHGPAGDRARWADSGKDDAERPLTEEGRVKTRRAAKGLADLVEALDVVASSPLVRARETARFAGERFPKARRVVRADLVPTADPARAARWLSSLGAGAAAVVGHEPHLSKLAALLLTGAPAPLFELKKGGAALLDLESKRLLALLPPRLLRRLGSRKEA